jgi:glycosyltransferase involved in cell wall biosynthesis
VTAHGLVSVVLPVHDGARHLEEALDACLRSDGVDLEVVAVDDASTDDTPAILASAARRDRRVRILRSERNVKLPGALNLGFAEARGAFLTWTSDDNLYRPTALLRMRAALADRPDAGVAYADYTVVDAEGRAIGPRGAGAPEDLGYSNVIGPCFLYRRSLAADVGPYAEDLFLAEDYDFWLRAAARTTFLHLPEDLYLYRQHGGSLTARMGAEVPLAVRAALERNLPALPRPLRAGALCRLEDIARARGERRVASRWWRRLLATDPVLALRRRARALLRPPSGP